MALWESKLPVAEVREDRGQKPATVKELANSYLISGKNFSYEISKHTAMPVQIVKNGVKQLLAPAVLSVWRAPIDNERKIIMGAFQYLGG